MSRVLAPTLVVLLAASLAACASPRAGESAAPQDSSAPSAADEAKWEPWPPPVAPPRAPAEVPKDQQQVIRVLPREGGWPVADMLPFITSTTGRPIFYDQTNATFKQAKVDFHGTLEMTVADLFAFAQAALSYRKLVLVPIGPKLNNGQQAWTVMDQADPNMKSRPVFLEENEVFDYAERDGLYVTTTLRVRDTVDVVRARNALSPLSTATAGIGRIQDMGGRFLIVSDFAPVVAAMKRLLDRINMETTPSALRHAPAPPPPPKPEKKSDG